MKIVPSILAWWQPPWRRRKRTRMSELFKRLSHIKEEMGKRGEHALSIEHEPKRVINLSLLEVKVAKTIVMEDSSYKAIEQARVEEKIDVYATIEIREAVKALVVSPLRTTQLGPESASATEVEATVKASKAGATISTWEISEHVRMSDDYREVIKEPLGTFDTKARVLVPKLQVTLQVEYRPVEASGFDHGAFYLSKGSDHFRAQKIYHDTDHGCGPYDDLGTDRDIGRRITCWNLDLQSLGHLLIVEEMLRGSGDSISGLLGLDCDNWKRRRGRSKIVWWQPLDGCRIATLMGVGRIRGLRLAFPRCRVLIFRKAFHKLVYFQVSTKISTWFELIGSQRKRDSQSRKGVCSVGILCRKGFPVPISAPIGGLRYDLRFFPRAFLFLSLQEKRKGQRPHSTLFHPPFKQTDDSPLKSVVQLQTPNEKSKPGCSASSRISSAFH
ncbi:hypothetical protein ACLOJK_025014 [Asimina triloba]